MAWPLFIAGGYFITRATARGLGRSVTLLPERLISASPCICVRESFRDHFDSLEEARAEVTSSSSAAEQIVVGFAVRRADADILIAEDKERPIAITLSRGKPLAALTSLSEDDYGFEILSYRAAYAMEHSWLCSGLENRAYADLKIAPSHAKHGLLDTVAEADAIMQLMARKNIAAEPGHWMVAAIAIYRSTT